MLLAGSVPVVVQEPVVMPVDTAEAFVMVVDNGPEHIAVDTVAVEVVDTAEAFVAGCIVAVVLAVETEFVPAVDTVEEPGLFEVIAEKISFQVTYCFSFSSPQQC